MATRLSFFAAMLLALNFSPQFANRFGRWTIDCHSMKRQLSDRSFRNRLPNAALPLFCWALLPLRRFACFYWDLRGDFPIWSLSAAPNSGFAWRWEPAVHKSLTWCFRAALRSPLPDLCADLLCPSLRLGLGYQSLSDRLVRSDHALSRTASPLCCRFVRLLAAGPAGSRHRSYARSTLVSSPIAMSRKNTL